MGTKFFQPRCCNMISSQHNQWLPLKGLLLVGVNHLLINPFSILVAYPSIHWAKGGVHLDQVTSLSKGWWGNLELPVNLTCMSGLWQETGQTHKSMGGHSNSRNSQTTDLNPEPSCCEGTVLTTIHIHIHFTLYTLLKDSLPSSGFLWRNIWVTDGPESGMDIFDLVTS